MGLKEPVLQCDSLTSYFFLYLPPTVWAVVAVVTAYSFPIALLPDPVTFLLSRFSSPLIIVHFG